MIMYKLLNHRNISILFMAFCVAWLMSCPRNSGGQSGGADTMTILVNHYLVPCTGMDFQWCLVYKEKGEEGWKYSYSDIEGLDYKWGYNYELEVEVVKEQNPPMDDPGGHFRLKKVVRQEREPSGTTFELILAEPGSGSSVSITDDGQWTIMGVKVVTDIPDESLKVLLEEINQTYVGLFQHTDQPNEIKLLNFKTE